MVRILLVLALTPLYLYVSTFRSMCAVLNMAVFELLLLLLLLLLLSSLSPLCRVSTLIFMRQTMSLGNTVLQLF